MKIRCSPLLAPVAVAMLAISGCASVPQADIDKRAAEMKVYTMDQFVTNKYDIVNRLWPDSWRSAFVVPVYPTQSEAMIALRAEAARLGADGLVNVNCLDEARQRWFPNPDPPAILCYGIAVRFRTNQG